MNNALTHRTVEVNGIRLHVAEQGQGPLVVLLHGWPESWYSWRHQFAPLVAAGYRVVAPDQRGYARSEQPSDPTAYTMLHLAGDVIALIKELGEEQAVVVGHDIGAPVAWVTAMLRPDVVRAVAGFSVPPALPAGIPPPSITRTQYGDGYYQIYFQQPGIPEGELNKDMQASFRRILYGASGDNPQNAKPTPWVIPSGMTILDTMPEPPQLPRWLTEAEIRAYAEDYARHGENAFTGGFNWYRNLERNSQLLAAFQGRRIDVPALYIAGDRDMVTSLHGVSELRAALGTIAPKLHVQLTLPGCGHWTQQERPDEVNAALLDFLVQVEAI